MKVLLGKINFRRAIYLSLGLHLLLALIVLLPSFPKTPPTQTITVEVVEPKPVVAAKQKPQQQIKIKQIVEQDHTINDEKPQKDAYLSEHNQTVKKETSAREHGEFRNAKADHSVEAKKSAGHKSADKKQVSEKPRLQELLGNDPVQMVKRQEERDRKNGEDGPGLQSGAEASRTNDYLKDVDRSKETILNTREFKYYTYYQRIRRQLSQYWEPKVHDKLTNMFKQGRRIASNEDHVTKLLITLNNSGILVKVQVLNASGVSDLDDAATEAFRAAAPFPNPPKGIVDEDGTVKIRWDFVLES